MVEEGPAFGAVAGLLDHLAFGGGEGWFAGFDSTGGKLDEELAGGVTVLALEDDVGVGGISRFVDCEDDDGAVVTDDVANVGVAAGFFDFVGEDGEDFTFVGKFGGDELCFGGYGGGSFDVTASGGLEPGPGGPWDLLVSLFWQT